MFLKKAKHIISLNLLLSSLNALYRNYFQVRRSKFGYIDKTARVRFPILIKGIENVYMHERTHILGHSLIITTRARFVMKKNSASAEGLTVVTGNHPSRVGELFVDTAAEDIQYAKDVVVEEDVWLGSNVTLLYGTHVGRGAVIGSGSVCRSPIPPYAIVVGNPARVIGFRFTPEEILEHEKKCYADGDRTSEEELRKNYQKYFLSRIGEIRKYINV